ncbi:transcriptional regulator [Deinococcus roseus]|uniref:Transcriptional regulator n=1 Tax=Deinococcus roseus TaxID=392414 RepID=A0ABQ2D036_9DEIO|nr:transcriptional regulator [Deinococcus roseus]
MAETGQFTEAAFSLGISQSSLSDAIAGLEKSLGVKLLQRGRFGAKLTPAGEQILPQVRLTLQAAESIQVTSRQLKGEISGQLTVSVFRSVASQIMPDVIAEMHRQHPAVNIQLLECACEVSVLQQNLTDGCADLTFLPEEDFADHLGWPVLKDPYVALFPEAWAEGLTTVTAEMLASRPLILGNDGNCAVRSQEYLQQKGFRDLRINLVQDELIIFPLVARGMGISLMPRLAVFMLPSGVKMLRLEDPFYRQISVAVRQKAMGNVLVKLLLGILKERLPEAQIPDSLTLTAERQN